MVGSLLSIGIIEDGCLRIPRESIYNEHSRRKGVTVKTVWQILQNGMGCLLRRKLYVKRV